MYDIITFGSSSVDVFVKTQDKRFVKDHSHFDVCYHIGGKILVEDVEIHTGGGATNTACAFSRLGLKTGCATLVGNDYNSNLILDDLKKEKIEFLGKKKQGKSGYSVILSDLKKDRTILSFKGVNDKLLVNDIKKNSLKAEWFYFSTLMGQSFATAKKLVSAVNKAGIPFTFNPSEYLAKKGINYLKDFLKCDLLVLNKQEAQHLTKNNTNDVSVLLETLAKYSLIVSITDGARGAYIYDKDKMLFLQADTAKIVDTTGAGDAIAAGLTYAVMKTYSLKNAIKFGYVLSRSVIQKVGAKPGLLTLKEAKKQMQKVNVKIKKM